MWALESDSLGLDEKLSFLCLNGPICGIGITKVAISGAVMKRKEINAYPALPCSVNLASIAAYSVNLWGDFLPGIQYNTIQSNPTQPNPNEYNVNDTMYM